MAAKLLRTLSLFFSTLLFLVLKPKETAAEGHDKWHQKYQNTQNYLKYAKAKN